MGLDFALIGGWVTGITAIFATQHSAALLLPLLHGVSLATFVTVVNSLAGLYRADRKPSHGRTVRAAIALVAALAAAYVALRTLPMAPTDAMVAWGMAGVGLLLLNRAIAGPLAARFAGKFNGGFGEDDSFGPRVLIVGCGKAAAVAVEPLRDGRSQMTVAGFFPGSHDEEVVVPAHEVLRDSPSLLHAALRVRATHIVVAVSDRRGGVSLRDLLDCKMRGIQVSDISTHFEKLTSQIRLDVVSAGWLVFGDGFNQRRLRMVTKRAFDLASALVLLVLASPVMLATMLLIPLDSRGPVFYRQQRTGLDGRPFDVVKFRSMRTDAERDGPRWATAADDRVTRVGRFIRTVRIDELPQLWNVIKGEMSMVGPRPERPVFVQELTAQLPYYSLRHSIKPGITGWAQVKYHYGSTVQDALEKLQYDLFYVKNHDLLLDLRVLVKTVAVVLLGKGAR